MEVSAILQRRLVVFNLWILAFSISGLLTTKVESFITIGVMTAFFASICEVIMVCAGKQFEKSPPTSLKLWIAVLVSTLILQSIMLSSRARKMTADQFSTQMISAALSIALTNVVLDFGVLPVCRFALSKLRASAK